MFETQVRKLFIQKIYTTISKEFTDLIIAAVIGEGVVELFIFKKLCRRSGLFSDFYLEVSIKKKDAPPTLLEGRLCPRSESNRYILANGRF